MGNMTPSKQDYLETIFDLMQENAAVRSVDVASRLGFSRASVSRAMKLLKEDGFLEQEPYGQITLTEKGLTEAESVRRRHDLLKYYLVHALGVDEKTAEEDACKMEHIVSQKTLHKMEEYSLGFLSGGKRSGEE